MFSTPILLMVFNRPDTTVQVLEALRKLQPKQLFIAGDGPRPDKPGEAERCEQTRAVAQMVDWPCEVQTNFHPWNLGCGRGVAANITWFFSKVSEGIILEDDILPDPSFFPFCEELLTKYRYDLRVAAIGGSNHLSSRNTNYSYYFSRYAHCWGWATWRRAWACFDYHMFDWPAYQSSKQFGAWINDPATERYWRHFLELMYQERMNTWDYAWTYSTWVKEMLSIVPAVNLTRNIGFGPEAAHTVDPSSAQARMQAHPIELPLRHPPTVQRDEAADRYTDQHLFNVGSIDQTLHETSSQLAQAKRERGAQGLLAALEQVPLANAPVEFLEAKMECLTELGRPREAAAIAQAVLNQCPFSKPALSLVLKEGAIRPPNAALEALRLGDLKQALSLIKSVIKLAPGTPQAHLVHALTLLQLGRYQEAAIEFGAEAKQCADPIGARRQLEEFNLA